MQWLWDIDGKRLELIYIKQSCKIEETSKFANCSKKTFYFSGTWTCLAASSPSAWVTATPKWTRPSRSRWTPCGTPLTSTCTQRSMNMRRDSQQLYQTSSIVSTLSTVAQRPTTWQCILLDCTLETLTSCPLGMAIMVSIWNVIGSLDGKLWNIVSRNESLYYGNHCSWRLEVLSSSRIWNSSCYESWPLSRTVWRQQL